LKPRRKPWLDTALRAQQARTLDRQYRVHETQTSQEAATQQESEAKQELHALASSWREGRDATQFTQQLDGLYQRFHAQLREQAAVATDARIVQDRALDAAVVDLRHSHALQRGLDRTVQRRDLRVAQEALAKERATASETWVLVQVVKKGSE
jgi:ABC-type uncharacterized transport system involved in gliding motility auxiliary subunit